MMRALARKGKDTVSVRERRVLRPEAGRVTKRTSDLASSRPRPFSGKFSITVGQVCRYLGLKEYPVIVTERSKRLWAELAQFEKFYLPLVAISNPGKDPHAMKTLVQAKWNQIISDGNLGKP